MWSKLSFLLISAFFVTMNVLLWRSQQAGMQGLGSVSPRVVWQKILTAPDIGYLEVRHRGARIGNTRWLATVGEDLPIHREISDEPPPEGMVQSFSSYNLEFDGHVMLDQSRVRFNLSCKWDTNYVWQQFVLRVTLRPNAWEIHASAAEQQFRIVIIDDEGREEQVHKFSELNHPDKLLRDLGVPEMTAALLSGWGGQGQGAGFSPSSAFHWEILNDTLQLGHAPIRGYKLVVRLLDRFQATAFVNTLGEVLRVELPAEVTLVNESLGSF